MHVATSQTHLNVQQKTEIVCSMCIIHRWVCWVMASRHGLQADRYGMLEQVQASEKVVGKA